MLLICGSINFAIQAIFAYFKFIYKETYMMIHSRFSY